MPRRNVPAAAAVRRLLAEELMPSLVVAANRGLPVSEGQRARLLAITDLAAPDGYLQRVLSVTSTEELLAPVEAR